MAQPPPFTDDQIKAASITAHLFASRLLNQQVTTVASKSSAEPKPVQLRTETTTTFAIALDNPEHPTVMQVEVEFNVTLRLEEGGAMVADYKGKNASEFKVIRWSGFSDWLKPPASTLTPYLAMAHYAAVRTAQQTLLNMGLGAVVLPTLPDLEATFTQADLDGATPNTNLSNS